MSARRLSGWILVAAVASVSAQKVHPAHAGMGVCRRAVFEGNAEYGKAFVQPLGGGLKWMLEPIDSGWIMRVLPAQGPRGQHDYAELATPPYQAPPYFSVSPLLLSTDFSFRAQDAVGWNPRRFRYAASREEFQKLAVAYDAYRRAATPAAQQTLAELVNQEPEGVFEILDTHLIPGRADQGQMAGAVASHFTTTAHSLDQADGKESVELGRITWVSFRVRLDLPSGFGPERGLRVEEFSCPAAPRPTSPPEKASHSLK